MAKITYIEHNGTVHEIDVKPGMTVMEGARQWRARHRCRLRWRLRLFHLPCLCRRSLGRSAAARAIPWKRTCWISPMSPIRCVRAFDLPDQGHAGT